MSLLFPAYLAGLLGLALPWLLHRFSDQQAPEQPFPSGRFLEATTPPVSRTRHLKYLVLLLLRVLSLLLLCFLFAQPWFERQTDDAFVSKHHVIAVDQSLSMRTGDRWSSAVSRAREIVGSLPAGDSAELLGVGAGLRRFGAGGELPSMQLQALASSEPGYGSTDYGALMQGVDRIAAESDVPVKAWVISDSQQSAVPSQLNALYAPRVAELVIESVVDTLQRNVHLAARALSSDGVNVQVNVQLMASVSGDLAGVTPTTGEVVTVQLHSGERLLVEQQVDLPFGELKTLVFDRLVMPASSDPVFTVSLLEDDDLPDDNQVDVVVKIANPLPVILLATDRDVSANAAVFLATALETDDLAQVELIAGNAERVPADAQHIITGRLITRALDLDVLQFVDSGANALVFSSASVGASASATVEQLTAASVTGLEMGVSDDAHPLELGKLDWSGTRFFDVPALELAPGDRVLLETSDRQPVLVERPTARGRLLLLNDRLDGLSSNLPLQPSFVSLMQSILAYFDASTALPDQMVAGSRLALPARMQVLDADDQPMLSLGASADSATIELSEPGLYRIVGIRGEHLLQVHPDAREADIRTMSATALSSWQARYEANGRGNGEVEQVADVERNRPDSAPVMTIAEAAGLAAWTFILPLLLLAFLMESALANRRLDVRRDGT